MVIDIGNGNFAAFLHLYDNEMLEDEEEFSWDEEKDELDEEYDRIRSVSQERIKSLDEKILESEQLLAKQVQEMDIARELVSLHFLIYAALFELVSSFFLIRSFELFLQLA